MPRRATAEVGSKLCALLQRCWGGDHGRPMAVWSTFERWPDPGDTWITDMWHLNQNKIVGKGNPKYQAWVFLVVDLVLKKNVVHEITSMSSMSSELSIGSAASPPGLPHLLQCNPTHHPDDPQKGQGWQGWCLKVLGGLNWWSLEKKHMLFPIVSHTSQGPTTPCHVFDGFCTLWSLESLS